MSMLKYQAEKLRRDSNPCYCDDAATAVSTEDI